MKKVPQTYWCTLELAVFRTAILVLVAQDKDTILEDLPYIYSKLGISKEDTKEDYKIIFKAFLEDVDDNLPPGYTIRLTNASGDVIMMFNAENISKVTEELIVHETHHAAHFVCSYRGIEDEECETYVQEYLFNRMLNKIDEWDETHKKKGKKK